MKDRCLDCGGRLDRLARPWCEMKSQHDAEEENGMSGWQPIETAPKGGDVDRAYQWGTIISNLR